MRVKHMTQRFYRASMRTTVDAVLRELKLVGKRLQLFCLLHTFFTYMAVYKLAVDDIVCERAHVTLRVTHPVDILH